MNEQDRFRARGFFGPRRFAVPALMLVLPAVPRSDRITSARKPARPSMEGIRPAGCDRQNIAGHMVGSVRRREADELEDQAKIQNPNLRPPRRGSCRRARSRAYRKPTLSELTLDPPPRATVTRKTVRAAEYAGDRLYREPFPAAARCLLRNRHLGRVRRAVEAADARWTQAQTNTSRCC